MTAVIDWGWAGTALEGVSGDVHVVVPFPGGALVALLDGLGHGVEAHAAATAAIPVLEDYATEGVLQIVQRCHEALRKTRGAVMNLASFRTEDSSLTWIGVGNIEGVLLRARGSRSDEAIHVRGGVVGYQLPPLRANTLTVEPGDVLVMASDGVRSGFSHGLAGGQPQGIAESVLARFAKGTDDAHVVVARYLGGGA